jgi:hypothetical protein
MEMSLVQANQMLKSNTLSIVSNCESQVGKLNSLSIKMGLVILFLGQKKTIDKTNLGDLLFLEVDLKIENLIKENLVSVRINRSFN